MHYTQEHVWQVIIYPEMGHFYFGRTGIEIKGKLTYSCEKNTSFSKWDFGLSTILYIEKPIQT